MRRIRGIEILFEDDDLIVIEKAAGLLTCATRRGEMNTVEELLSDYVRKGQWKSRKRVYLVHRLDRETSGVMMVAKNERTQEYFRSKWNEVTTKVYLARVAGEMETDSGAYESWLLEDADGYKVRSVPAPRPVPRLPSVASAKEGSPSRLCLHAWKLSFVHPRTKREMSFETKVPKFAQ